MAALRVAAAEIALDHLAAVAVVVDGAEGAGDGAHLAADAHRFQHVLGTGFRVDHDGVHRARLHAPGLVALGAGVGNEAPLVVKGEHLDARLGGIEHALVLERAGHFALQTARALAGVDVKRFQHGSSSSFNFANGLIIDLAAPDGRTAAPTRALRVAVYAAGEAAVTGEDIFTCGRDVLAGTSGFFFRLGEIVPDTC
jgi:hypothetical protein